MSYSKLHSSIVNSSLWTEPDAVRLLFVTLLATCDKDGAVYGSRTGLNRLANVDPDEADGAWDILMSPDPESSDRMRAPENEGRRIEEIPGGFRLLNFSYYRGLRNDDDRREQNRLAQAKFKARSKPQKAEVSRGKPQKAHTETEAETNTEAEADTPIPPAAPASPSLSGFDEFWKAYPKRAGKGTAETAWKKHGCSKLLPQILVSIRACKISADWLKEGGQFIPHPATWLNRRGWEDELLPRNGNAPGSINESIVPNIIEV